MFSDVQDPCRLFVGIANSLRRVAEAVEDPYARRQLQATVDVLLRISPSVGWTDEALAEDRGALELVAGVLPGDADVSSWPREALLVDIEHRLQRLVGESASPRDPSVVDVIAELANVVEAELRLTQTGNHYAEK